MSKESNSSLSICLETKTGTMFCKCCLAAETTPNGVTYQGIMRAYAAFKKIHNESH